MAEISSNRFKILASVFLILVVTFISFYPVFRHDFVHWDDPQYVQDNLSIRRLTAGNIRRIFTSFYVGNYQPLAILSYAVDYSLFRLNPAGYHTTNLLFHLLNCLLVFALIRRLRGAVFAAFLTALFFGIHPMHVESVAWIAERKDMLYAFFYLGAMIAYAQYIAHGSRQRDYYLCLILFVFSCLSKSMAVTLPAVLLIMDHYLTGRVTRKDIARKIPFVIIAVIFIVVAFIAQKNQGGLRYMYKASFPERLAFVFPALAFYLVKITYPVDLSAIYRYSNIAFSYLPRIFFFSPWLVLSAAAGVVYSFRFSKKIVFGSLFFIIAISPVLQVIPFGNVLAADRYTYVPAIGLFFICAEFFRWLFFRFAHNRAAVKTVLAVFICSLIIVMGKTTWNRVQVWKNSFVLFDDVLQKNPSSVVAFNNRGKAYLDQGRLDMAINDFRNAVRANPRRPNAYVNLGIAHIMNGKPQKAVPFFEKAITLDSRNESAYFGLANAYADLGQDEKAIEAYNKSIGLNPLDAAAYHNLATVYIAARDTGKALTLLNKAVALDPDFAEAHNTLAVVYFEQGEVALARHHCAIAMDLGYSPEEDFLHDLDVSP